MRSTLIRMAALLLLGLALLSAQPECAFACSCVPPEPPERELERATAVFEGRVLQIKGQVGPMVSSADPNFVLLEVSRVWKGQPNSTIVVETAASGASCGYQFQQGQEYIVYASLTQGRLNTSLCSRTRPVAEAAEDLAVLGAGEVPPVQVESTVEPSVDRPVMTTPSSSDRALMLAAAVSAGLLLLLGLAFGLRALKRRR